MCRLARAKWWLEPAGSSSNFNELIHVQKLIGTQQSLAEVSESLQLRRGPCGQVRFLILLCFRFLLRSERFQMRNLAGKKLLRIRQFWLSCVSAEGELPSQSDLPDSV